MPRSVLKIWSGAAPGCGAAAYRRGAASYSRIYLKGIPASLPGMTRPDSAARLGRVARNLGVNAHIVEGACRDGSDDVARVGAVCRRRTVISALAGSNSSDDQPNQQNEPSDSHFYLRKTGGSCFSEELRTRDVCTSTPYTADTRGRGIRCPADSVFRATRHIRAGRFPRRCMVSADGPGWQHRAARTRGTRSAHPSAGFPAGRRRRRALGVFSRGARSGAR